MHCIRLSCAAVRHSFREDPRYVRTLRDPVWRETMRLVPGWCMRRALKQLRRQREVDASLLRQREVDASTLTRHNV